MTPPPDYPSPAKRRRAALRKAAAGKVAPTVIEPLPYAKLGPQ